MGPTQPPIQFNGYWFFSRHVVVGGWGEDDHSPSSLAKDETLLRYTFSLLYAIMAYAGTGLPLPVHYK